MKIRHIIRQIIRGCGTLPHVGDHPGTMLVILLVGMSAMFGAMGGDCMVYLFLEAHL